eukprot:7839829-Pyramimonas_sp.AAC.1
MAQERPKRAQDRTRALYPRGFQVGPDALKRTSTRHSRGEQVCCFVLPTVHEAPAISSRWPDRQPKSAPQRRKRVPRRPKSAPSRPKRRPRSPKRAPRRF